MKKKESYLNIVNKLTKSYTLFNFKNYLFHFVSKVFQYQSQWPHLLSDIDNMDRMECKLKQISLNWKHNSSCKSGFALKPNMLKQTSWLKLWKMIRFIEVKSQTLYLPSFLFWKCMDSKSILDSGGCRDLAL